MMANAMGDCNTCFGDCVNMARKPSCFRIVTSLFFASSSKDGSSSNFQNSSMKIATRRPSNSDSMRCIKYIMVGVLVSSLSRNSVTSKPIIGHSSILSVSASLSSSQPSGPPRHQRSSRTHRPFSSVGSRNSITALNRRCFLSAPITPAMAWLI